MGHYSAVKEQTIDTCDTDESWGNYAVYWKSISKCYICVIRLFLKWQNYRNGEQNSDGQGLRSVCVERELGIAIKGQREGSLQGWKCLVSWLHQCQCPGWYCTSSARCYNGGNRLKMCGISLHYFLLHVNLQLSQIKHLIKK